HHVYLPTLSYRPSISVHKYPSRRFGLEGKEEFYIAFKEKHVIHAEAQFDAESFKTAFPDIYHQIGTCVLLGIIACPSATL
ncbi:hypothetical protein HAX54_051668, partial [Datura stramonium]|nr:hypothetical protein [Datura stramonium]